MKSVNFTDGFMVFFPSSASRNHTLYPTTDLAAGEWTNVPLQADLSGSGSVDVLTDPSSTDAQRFYRVGVRLP